MLILHNCLKRCIWGTFTLRKGQFFCFFSVPICWKISLKNVCYLIKRTNFLLLKLFIRNVCIIQRLFMVFFLWLKQKQARKIYCSFCLSHFNTPFCEKPVNIWKTDQWTYVFFYKAFLQCSSGHSKSWLCVHFFFLELIFWKYYALYKRTCRSPAWRQ